MYKPFIFIILSVLLIACSGTKTLVDPRDHQEYTISKIKGKWWTTRNMNFAVDGYQYYNNEAENAQKSGKMYTWFQAQKVCPPGWRLPTEKELIDLFLPYGKISYAGDAEPFDTIFGPYAPEKTEETYFKLINDKKLNIPVFDLNGVEEQRTMIWSGVSTSEDRAYAIYWRIIDQYIEYNSVHFSDYPKAYDGFCRCVKDE
jgi:uncharacterized protein (TIGR02145 family)